MANSRPARLQEKSQKYLRAHFGSSSPPVYKECKLNACVALFAGGTPYPTIANQRLFQVLSSGYRLEKPPMCTEETWEFFFAFFDIETFLIRQCEQKNTLSCMVRIKPFKKIQILICCLCTFPIEVVGRICESTIRFILCDHVFNSRNGMTGRNLIVITFRSQHRCNSLLKCFLLKDWAKLLKHFSI